MKLDQKYQKMYDELLHLRKKNKDLKLNLESKLKVLKKDFDDWKSQEPPIILPDSNIYTFNLDKIDMKKSTKSTLKEETDKNNINFTTFESIPTNHPEQQKRIHESSKQTELSLQQKLIKIANELPELREGEEVLARWPDDGWYYRSIVKKKLNECKYQLEDSLKDIEIVSREDILSEIDDSKFNVFTFLIDNIIFQLKNYSLCFINRLVILL